MSSGPRALFIGKGASAVAWYRCVLPAHFLGHDWCGVDGEPPKLRFATGMVGGRTTLPNFLDYEVIVIQQPRGRGWRKLIRDLQERGIVVIYEVDDYLHGITQMKDHDFRHGFSKDDLRELELCMKAADGLICSTTFIAEKYRRFNDRVWVCENGVDLSRYRLTRPQRPTVNIGWAGGTGHERAIVPWFTEAFKLCVRRPDTAFVTIGQPYADQMKHALGERAISVPFCAVETYPAAMTLLDIALAPAVTRGRNRAFFKGKSDLRWLEAGALGIPVIADPRVYPKIEHGVTGFHAATPEAAGELLEQLVDDPSLRLEVGHSARRYVEDHRDMPIAARQWARVLEEAVNGPTQGTSAAA